MSQLSTARRVDSVSSGTSSPMLSDDNSRSPTLNVVDGTTVASVARAAGPVTLSKWGIGRSTLVLMIVFYLTAFIIAIIHLVLFRYLDGKSTSTSQTYISTTSNLLAYLFTTAIRISLAVAFTQHLWWIMRQSAMKVSTIEVLFNIRSNPFEFFRLSAIKDTWILGLLAAVLYIIPIATSFPPGALTVKSTSPISSHSARVPTFNASFVGNGSIGSAFTNSLYPWNYLLDPLNTTWSVTFTSGVGTVLLGSLERLASVVVVTGGPLAMESPCGPNCSYTIEFEGPVFDCYSEAKEIQISYQSSLEDEAAWDWALLDLETFYFGAFNVPNGTYKAPPLFYEGLWNYPGGLPSSNATESQGVYTQASFFTSTLNSTDFLTPPITITQSNLSCIPSRALYTLQNSYVNNIQSLNYSTGPSTQLTDTRRPAFLNGTYSTTYIIPGLEYPWGELLGDWSEEALAWYRDCNMMALIQQICYPLNGTFFTQSIYQNETGNLESESLEITETLRGGTGPAFSFVSNSQLSTTFQNYDLSAEQDNIQVGSTSFNVTEEVLNRMVGDLTVSAVIAYGLWTDIANVSISQSQNVYTFSQPINLLIPYFLTLALSLPFLFIGTSALYKNGVPAGDGGFIQILSTTTGSRTLQRAATWNCLGGEEQISKGLKDLEIQFGELVEEKVDSGGKSIRRAGFGTKAEIVPLLKGESYGGIA